MIVKSMAQRKGPAKRFANIWTTDFDQGAKERQWKKIVFLANVIGQLDIYI